MTKREIRRIVRETYDHPEWDDSPSGELARKNSVGGYLAKNTATPKGEAFPKKPVPKLKTPVYMLADAIQALKNVARQLADDQLIEVVQKIGNLEARMRNYLNGNYIWD